MPEQHQPAAEKGLWQETEWSAEPDLSLHDSTLLGTPMAHGVWMQGIAAVCKNCTATEHKHLGGTLRMLRVHVHVC